MSLSNRLLAAARRILRLYGQSLSFSRVVEGSFVPSTGAIGAGTTTSYTAYGAPVAIKLREIDNTNIMQDDLFLWVEVNTSGSIPTIGDVVTVNGTVYRVLNVEKFYTQGSVVLYKLLIRI